MPRYPDVNFAAIFHGHADPLHGVGEEIGMVAQGNWRDAEKKYRYLKDLNAAELAWEFLWRNSDYQKEVAASDPLDDRAVAALNAHWGLRFPDTSGPARHERRHLLEPRCRSGRNHSDADSRTRLDYGNDLRRSDQCQIG